MGKHSWIGGRWSEKLGGRWLLGPEWQMMTSWPSSCLEMSPAAASLNKNRKPCCCCLLRPLSYLPRMKKTEEYPIYILENRDDTGGKAGPSWSGSTIDRDHTSEMEVSRSIYVSILIIYFWWLIDLNVQVTRFVLLLNK